MFAVNVAALPLQMVVVPAGVMLAVSGVITTVVTDDVALPHGDVMATV